MTKMLRRMIPEGIEVQIALAENLSQVEAEEGQIEQVIMPGMNGKVMAEQLKAACPEMLVLYMSGYTDNAIAHHGVLDTGVAFIGKPFTPAALGRKAREVLDS